MVLTFASGDVLEHPQLNNMIRALNGDGVISGFAVTQNTPTADMSVNVALGEALIGGMSESESGTTNLVIEAAHATEERKDLITYDASGDTPAVVKGTDHAGTELDPTYPPDIPAGDILLAIVKVNAAATTIATGDITDGRIIINPHVVDLMASDALLQSSDAEVNSSSATYVKLKEFVALPSSLHEGTIRIKYDASGIGTIYCRVYRNGIAVGAEQSISSGGSYNTYSEDTSGWGAGDLIQLYAKTTTSVYVKNFRAYGNYILDW